MGVNSKVISLLETALSLLRAGEENLTSASEDVSYGVQGQVRRQIAWGSKVSPLFRERVWWIADTLRLNPDDLMACIAFESGRTFKATVRNAAGSGAIGLIQFMPNTAVSLGTSTTKLAGMTAEDQLNFVYRYLRPYAGKLNSVEDLYMSILWPKAVGQPLDYPLFTGGISYRQNSGLDSNKDGKVTKREAAAKVRKVLEEGLLPRNLG